MFALLEVRCCRKKQGDLSRAHLVVDVDNRFVVDALREGRRRTPCEGWRCRLDSHGEDTKPGHVASCPGVGSDSGAERHPGGQWKRRCVAAPSTDKRHASTF